MYLWVYFVDDAWLLDDVWELVRKSLGVCVRKHMYTEPQRWLWRYFSRTVTQFFSCALMYYTLSYLMRTIQRPLQCGWSPAVWMNYSRSSDEWKLCHMLMQWDQRMTSWKFSEQMKPTISLCSCTFFFFNPSSFLINNAHNVHNSFSHSSNLKSPSWCNFEWQFYLPVLLWSVFC